jgi:hypothetical protein
MVSLQEAARRIGCSRQHARTLVDRGMLPAIDISATSTSRPRLRIDPDDIEAFIEAQRVRPVERQAHQPIDDYPDHLGLFTGQRSPELVRALRQGASA